MIKDRLGSERCILFRQTCFGKWLDLAYVENEERLIHFMLQKQKFSDTDHYDLPLIYNVNEHILHFGRREFCLISGFKFGWLSFRKFRQGDITFRDRVFPEKIGEDLKNIDLLSLIEDEIRFTSLSDSDSVRVCLLLSLELIFMGHDLPSVVEDVFLRMVEDLDSWNDFAWGEMLWRELYDAIRNVSYKHRQDHLKALESNPTKVPTYSLSGFLLCFKIWILESSCMTHRWWMKTSEGIPRGCLWSKHLILQSWETPGLLFPQDKKPKSELYPNRAEAQSEWFMKSSDYFKVYTPRAPPVEYGGLFGDYLKRVAAARARMECDNETVPKEVSLKDRVRAMESLCSILMVLPKEVKSLKDQVHKLQTVVKVLYKKKRDLPQMYNDCTSDLQCDPDGELFFTYPGSPKSTASKDAVNEMVDAFDDLVDQNGVGEVDQNLSQYEDLKAQKLEAEKIRVAEQKKRTEWRRLQEENRMKRTDLTKSNHMKLALDRCGAPNKRRYVHVLRPAADVVKSVPVLSIDILKKKSNVLDEFMIERCKDLKPWKEDLKRPSKSIDKIHCNYYVEQFLSTSGWKTCKFPWCPEIVVRRNFFDALVGLDDERVGWLLDDHIELWVWYMWHYRQSCHDWSIVSCYFLTLLLQDSMPSFYATDEIYPLAWKDVEQVFIPINEPKSHWSLAQFHISSGNITFYDSQMVHEPEIRPWYVDMRRCLETKLPVVLEETGVFASKGIDPASYTIKFNIASKVPKQGGVFGDCGVYVCLFLYRLSHGVPLAVEDPIQTALAYREQMVQFYFDQKIISLV